MELPIRIENDSPSHLTLCAYHFASHAHQACMAITWLTSDYVTAYGKRIGTMNEVASMDFDDFLALCEEAKKAHSLS